MSPEFDNESWETYKKLVIAALERNEAAINKVREDIYEIKMQIAISKVKISIIGSVAGFVASGIGSLVVYLLKQNLAG